MGRLCAILGHAPQHVRADNLLPAADPTTKAYLQSTLDPIFGYPSLVRFSWSTVKVILEKGGKEVRWCARNTLGRHWPFH